MDRAAAVRFINKTDLEFSNVYIKHAYSNDEPTSHVWQNVGAHSATSDDLVADYKTGFGRIGNDWWLIAAITPAGELWMIDPANGRGTIDFLENTAADVFSIVNNTIFVEGEDGKRTINVDLLKDAFSAFGEIAGGAGAAATGAGTAAGAVGAVGASGAAAPVIAATVVAYAFLNLVVGKGATEGCKAFMLRSEDEVDGVEISLVQEGEDYNIVFSAKSGTASTPLYRRGRTWSRSKSFKALAEAVAKISDKK